MNPKLVDMPALGSLIEAPMLSRLLVAIVLGLIVHQLVFKKGEWHLQAPTIFILWLGSFPILFIGELAFGARSVWGSAWSTIMISGCFTSTVFLSLTVYRLFFHRLGKFPGPRLAAVSKLWHFYQCLDSKNHRMLDDLHRKYGDFVRTGESGHVKSSIITSANHVQVQTRSQSSIRKPLSDLTVQATRQQNRCGMTS